jgi:hypothetical protein
LLGLELCKKVGVLLCHNCGKNPDNGLCDRLFVLHPSKASTHLYSKKLLHRKCFLKAQIQKATLHSWLKTYAQDTEEEHVEKFKGYYYQQVPRDLPWIQGCNHVTGWKCRGCYTNEVKEFDGLPFHSVNQQNFIRHYKKHHGVAGSVKLTSQKGGLLPTIAEPATFVSIASCLEYTVKSAKKFRALYFSVRNHNETNQKESTLDMSSAPVARHEAKDWATMMLTSLAGEDDSTEAQNPLLASNWEYADVWECLGVGLEAIPNCLHLLRPVHQKGPTPLPFGASKEQMVTELVLHVIRGHIEALKSDGLAILRTGHPGLTKVFYSSQ